ncbi:hypothetical protein BJ322DRAFT_989447, partial [Thelephora terrestris]
PVKPQPLTEDAAKDTIEEYKSDMEKYKEWMHGDIEVKHYIHATIPDSLHIQTVNCTTIKEIWDTI